MRLGLVLLLLVAGSACAAQSDGTSSIPGPSLDGPNVVTYPLGPYSFKEDARKEIRQGFKSGDGCGQASSGTLAPGQEVQEIVIAEDPDTCRFLVVVGTPADQ
jgi:hypothetical protein